jgi:hypothetical protein
LLKPMLLALAAASALVAGMAVGASDETDLSWATSRRTAVTTAHWIIRPHSLRELADEGPAAILARVRAARPGPPLPDEGHARRTPTQRVALAVEQRLLGNAPARIELFNTGSQTEWIEEDPPYSVGERYLLFVRPRRGDGRRAVAARVPGRPPAGHACG